jgi:serine/threonine-protein kinase
VPRSEEPVGDPGDSESVDWDRVEAKVLDALRDTGELERPAELVLPAPLDERLEILEELGRGAFGQVYRARDRMLGREVALKILGESALASSKARARFLEEARTLAGLKHPNIVQLHWIETIEGRVYMILELIRGKTLHQLHEDEGTLAPAEAARVGADLCRALAELHGKGLVHMDIKPANVVREEGGRIVLLDFGLARASIPEGTRAGLGGTPLFMSPEVLAGRDEIPPASDIYSVGVLLYWAVSNRYPYKGLTLQEVHGHMLAGEATPLLDVCPEVPSAFAATVNKAIASAEEDRFASVGALEQELSGFLAGASPAPAPGETEGVRRGVVLTLALVLLAALVWVFAAGRGSSPQPLDFECQVFATRDGVDVPLDQNAAVALGDLVFLRARAERGFHLYVFNEDDSGRSYTLFPIPELGLLNPVPGGSAQRLPGGEDDPGHWLVGTEGGGAEHLYVVASLEPLEAMEALRAYVPAAERGPAGVRFEELDDLAKNRITRGMGQLVGAHNLPADTADRRLGEVFSRLERHLDESSGVVMQTIRLSH